MSTPASTAIVEVPAPPRAGSASSTLALSVSRSSRDGTESGPGGPERARRPDPGADRAPSRDDLDPDSARVLDALPARGGAGTSTIAVEAGVDLDTVLRCLGRLAGYGFIERCDRGWRLRKP